jgi:AbrB family looped-hinge helix DNA binding protein
VSHTWVERLGRIVLPKRIRTRFGLEYGSVLEITESAEGIALRPEKAKPPVAEKDGVLVFTGTATGDLEAALDRHRSERVWPSGAKRIQAP